MKQPAGKKTEDGQSCEVDEKRFPCIGRCCDTLHGLTGTVFEPRCPQCRIWTSMPNSVSLKVASFIECGLYGYGRRITEEKK